jgi:hypothetical protein
MILISATKTFFPRAQTNWNVATCDGPTQIGRRRWPPMPPMSRRERPAAPLFDLSWPVQLRTAVVIRWLGCSRWRWCFHTKASDESFILLLYRANTGYALWASVFLLWSAVAMLSPNVSSPPDKNVTPARQMGNDGIFNIMCSHRRRRSAVLCI